MLIKLNGRTKFAPRLKTFERSGPGHYWGELTSGVRFKIEGGKYLGGSRRDWFLEADCLNGAIACNSVSDALDVICNA